MNRHCMYRHSFEYGGLTAKEVISRRGIQGSHESYPGAPGNSTVELKYNSVSSVDAGRNSLDAIVHSKTLDDYETSRRRERRHETSRRRHETSRRRHETSIENPDCCAFLRIAHFGGGLQINMALVTRVFSAPRYRARLTGCEVKQQALRQAGQNGV